MLRGGNEGLLIAFLGDLDEEQAALTARMRGRTGAAVAFVLDSGTWLTGGAVSGAVENRVRQLREAGWTALAVAPGARIADVWQQAAGARTESAADTYGGWS